MKLSGNSDYSLGVLDFDAAGQWGTILPTAAEQCDTCNDGNYF